MSSSFVGAGNVGVLVLPRGVDVDDEEAEVDRNRRRTPELQVPREHARYDMQHA